MRSRFVEPLERRTFLTSNGNASGVVYDDRNGNGVRETGEPGLANQVVYLDLNLNGELDTDEPSRTTNSSGVYLLPLSDVPNRVQRVRHIVPSGRRLSAPGSIFHDIPTAIISDTTGKDFGNTNTAVIRGNVFGDLNGDGLRGTTERGLSGWTVFLDKDNDGVYDPGLEKVRVTNSNGDYRFAGLTPGTYRVRIVQKPGFVLTNPISGGFTVRVTFAQGVSNRNFAEM